MIDIILGNFNKIAGAILSAVFVAYLGYRTYRKTRYNQAAATFTRKVLTELEGLYPIPSNWPKDGLVIDPILREKFPRLQTAVVEFKKLLPCYRKKAFEAAWFCFYNGNARETERECQCYNQYIGFSDNPYKEKFKHNVDNLLKFAKLT